MLDEKLSFPNFASNSVYNNAKNELNTNIVCILPTDFEYYVHRLYYGFHPIFQ